MKVAIWDLDNCLSNDKERLKLIDWKTDDMEARYAAYHECCDLDPVGNLALYRFICINRSPVFFTARPEAVREKTVNWITEKLGAKKPLVLMRESRDHTPTAQLKRRMLLNFLNGVGKHLDSGAVMDLAAFDDRLDVVKMYQDAGIHSLQIKIHSVCALTPPRSLA